ncbi:MAG: 16S rRNA (cytosine(1402)-N(4))-methyltransferase RsmH [Chloroflexi bacterium]|nr:16S rRNA (cytosine(1402)-N(4))-methyltransferase RsmH [Chloroflexota bacterium]
MTIPAIDVRRSSTHHVPVLLDEVVQFLRPYSGGRYVDCTLGGGGHSEALLSASDPDGLLLGVDCDDRALAAASMRLSRFGARFQGAKARFADLSTLLSTAGWTNVDGILADLGFSSDQIDSPGRGFSFRLDEPLDMRLDQRSSVATARDIVNRSSEDELAELLRQFGEEPFAKRIARAVVARRRTGPIQTTAELARIVSSAVPNSSRSKIHPATRTFQALRIAVNDELGQLAALLPQGVQALRPGGRLAIISFHSLEDRIVKQFFSREASTCLCSPEVPICSCGHRPSLRVVTKHPCIASEAERRHNYRSRSAKLRVAERLLPERGDRVDGGSDTV